MSAQSEPKSETPNNASADLLRLGRESLGSAHPAFTISSLDIAERTGKEHFHVLRDIRDMLEQLDIAESRFGCSYLDSTGRTLPMFNLPRREALILASGYSTTLRAKLVDRLEELETQARTLDTMLTQRPAFPSTATPLIDHPTYLELKALALKDAQWELKSLVGRRLRAYMHNILVPDGSEETPADPTPEADMVVMQLVFYVENALKLLEIENKVKARATNLSLHKFLGSSK